MHDRIIENMDRFTPLVAILRDRTYTSQGTHSHEKAILWVGLVLMALPSC
jgi:hypothetical protein